tara:strand:+ start:424 stop:1134 length:711 start_codon:yes stop_codon:yes gene_type:complete
MKYESEKVTAVKSAIEKARQGFKPLKKSGVNSYFKSKSGEPHLFSTLDDIFDACLDSLNENKLSITYQVRLLETQNGFENILTTNISHTESGEYILSASLLGNQTAKSQDLGSAITYMRRYQIQAMLNLEADFEDDGNNASGRVSGTIENKKPSRTYTTFDRDGKSNGTYTNFVSYVKALNIDAMKMHPEWVTQTERQLHDIDIWAKALGDEDVKAKDALIKKCSELSQKIGVKDE